MSDTLTFDKRAEKVKKSFAATEGKFIGDTVPEELKLKGVLSDDEVRNNIMADMPTLVKQAELLRAGGKNAKCVDISLAKMLNHKYGIAYDKETQMVSNDFFRAVGIDPSMCTIESLMSMPDIPEGYTWLLPEIIRESVRLGMRRAPIYTNLIAAEQNVNQPQVITPAINMSDAMPTIIGEAETIPLGSLSFGEKTVRLKKVATGIQVSDEFQRYVNLDAVTIYLQDVGAKMNVALDSEAIDVLVNGDQADGSDAIATIGATTAGTLTYQDILRAWIRLGILGRTPESMIANEQAAMDILSLEEFEGLMGSTTLANINLQTPVPSDQALYLTGNAPEGQKILFVDRNAAMMKLNATALTVESERIVRRQINGTYVSMVTGFTTMFRDARLLLDYSLAFGTNGFPEWMNPYGGLQTFKTV